MGVLQHTYRLFLRSLFSILCDMTRVESLDIASAEDALQQDMSARQHEHAVVCEDDDIECLRGILQRIEHGEEYESRERVNASIAEFISSARKVEGKGFMNDFCVVDTKEIIPEGVSHISAEALGVRSLRMVPRRFVNRATGEEKSFLGLPVSREHPRPFEEFIHGAKVQMLAHEKGVSVPLQYLVVVSYGAKELPIQRKGENYSRGEEGIEIPELEDEITGVRVVMEKVPGKTLEQICDPGFDFRNKQRGSYSSENSITTFLSQNEQAVYENVWDAIDANPLMLEWDTDNLITMLGKEVELLHTASEKYPAILHNDLHVGNSIISPDGKKITLIDFDMARVVEGDAGDIAGGTLEEYKDMAKYTDTNRVFFLPDTPYTHDEEENERYAPICAIDQYKAYFKVVKRVIADYKNGARAYQG